MPWNPRLRRTGMVSRHMPGIPTATPRKLLLGAALSLAGVASCVSLSSPRNSTSNLPVATGKYSNGRNQLVRIALAMGGESRIGGTGDWAVYQDGSDRTIARYAASDPVGIPPGTNVSQQWSTVSGYCSDVIFSKPKFTLPSSGATLVVRPLRDGSFVTWNGK